MELFFIIVAILVCAIYLYAMSMLFKAKMEVALKQRTQNESSRIEKNQVEDRIIKFRTELLLSMLEDTMDQIRSEKAYGKVVSDSRSYKDETISDILSEVDLAEQNVIDFPSIRGEQRNVR